MRGVSDIRLCCLWRGGGGGLPQTPVNVTTFDFTGLGEVVENLFLTVDWFSEGAVCRFNRQMPPTVRKSNTSVLVSEL